MNKYYFLQIKSNITTIIFPHILILGQLFQMESILYLALKISFKSQNAKK